MDLILPFELADDTFDYFSEIYAEFLESFTQTFPEINITSKLHFLIHFASMVRKNGQPRVYWTMAHERFNGSIKQPSHATRNYRVPQKTLAYRAQCTWLDFVLTPPSTTPIMNKCKLVYMDDLKNHPLLQGSSVVCESIRDVESPFEIGSNLSFNSVEYSKGSYVVVSSSEGHYTFGRILLFIREQNADPLFVLQLFKSTKFDQHSFTYRIQENACEPIIVVKLNELLDYHPLDGMLINDNIFIRMKYYINAY